MARKRIRVKPKTSTQQKDYGGWYKNPDTGTNMRWFDGVWTDGAEPSGSTPTTQAPTAQTSSGDLFSQYQGDFAKASQQESQRLQDYSASSAQLPSFKQKLMDAVKKAGQYPSQTALREEYSKIPNLTPMAAESLIAKRGQSTRGTIQDIINRAYGGLQSEVEGRRGAYEQAQGQRSNLLEDYQLQYQSEQDALDRVRQTEQDKFAREKSLRTGSATATAASERKAKETRLSDIVSYLTSPEVGSREEAQESIRSIIQRNPDLISEILATGEALYPEAKTTTAKANKAVQEWVDEQFYAGMSREEIRLELQKQGYDPNLYL